MEMKNNKLKLQIDLKYLIENECFIQCEPLPSDKFISFCKDRGIFITRKELERFEKLGLFFPIARVKYPKIRQKIEYLDGKNGHRTVSELKDSEKWNGETQEFYKNLSLESHLDFKSGSLDFFSIGSIRRNS